MAEPVPLGARVPSGLQYLIAEGLLPSDPSEALYTWKRYAGKDIESGEELLFTDRCAIYSKGGYPRRTFRFDEDDEHIRFADLTNFRYTEGLAHSSARDQHAAQTLANANGGDAPSEARPFGRNRRLTRKSDIIPSPDTELDFDGTVLGEGTRRALTLFIGKRCHVCFVEGSTHIVNMPFDVEQVFPSYMGVIVRRCVMAPYTSSDSVPNAPPNSFRSSQPQVSPAAHIASASMDSSKDPAIQDFLASNLHGDPSSLYESDLPQFLLLSDPLVGFSTIAAATIAPVPRHLRLNDTDLLIEYDDFDDSESLLYVSTHDEMGAKPSAGNAAPLLIVASINAELGQLTIWQGWHLYKRRLSTLTAIRRKVRTSRARRRSSFNGGAMALGNATPAVRFHDKGRESFAANAQLPKGKTPRRRTKSKTAPAKEEDEVAVMASRLDPEYRLSQQSIARPRRAGSGVSRGELITLDHNRGHNATHNPYSQSARRGPSFRASSDRRSFGTSIYRKSRGSAPGSTFSRSVGPDGVGDDSMDFDSDAYNQAESEHEVSRITQLYLATNDLSSADSAFASGIDGGEPAFVLRKVHIVALPGAGDRNAPNSRDRYKVRIMLRSTTLTGQFPTLAVFLHDKVNKQTTQVNFKVLTSLPMDASVEQSGTATVGSRILVPIYDDHKTLHSIRDIVKLEESDSQAIISLTAEGRLIVTPSDSFSWELKLPQQWRVYDQADIRSNLDQAAREFGVRRILEVGNHVKSLAEADAPQSVLLWQDDNALHLQVRINTQPLGELVRRSMDIIMAVLPSRARLVIPMIWHESCAMLGQQRGFNDNSTIEIEALCMSVLSFAIGSLSFSYGKNGREGRVSLRKSNPTHLLDATRGSMGGSRKQWTNLERASDVESTSSGRKHATNQDPGSHRPSLSFTSIEANTRQLLHRISTDETRWLLDDQSEEDRAICSLRILLALQSLREETWLSNAEASDKQDRFSALAACVAQLGHYLGMERWTWTRDTSITQDFGSMNWDFSKSAVHSTPLLQQYQESTPFMVTTWLEATFKSGSPEPLVTLEDIINLGGPIQAKEDLGRTALLLPRLSAIRRYVHGSSTTADPVSRVKMMHESGITRDMIQTMPDSITVYLREVIARCQSHPPSTWSPDLLRLIDREDLASLRTSSSSASIPPQSNTSVVPDTQAIIISAERPLHLHKSHATDRNVVASHLFSEDRRLIDVSNLMNPAALQVAECPARPEWTDIEHLEQQKRVMAWVMVRTIALPAGNGMFSFESQMPLLSEKFHVPGFSMQCQMKPMDNTISADRTGFTEEKLNWAFFHAGTAAGLNISRKASGIDTSWILFNKPQDLTNRHAGFLFALGLNGHLRIMAKWLAFKYLTPKHTMTSIGLLLGLSASHRGTMDTLITRMLSVHITRMLPPGAAELNVSPLTQTAGLIGIGLLYYNTQHRRMSEIMLSELEHRDMDEAGSAADVLRDESYRLASGIALGLINLGKGGNLQGLQGMSLLERLLSIAVGPRPVELVHVVDKATAGSILALTLVYMKTMDGSIARKIDVPSTASQLDHVRPDMLLLRTLAKNLIMWNDIKDQSGWIHAQLPTYAAYVFSEKSSTVLPVLPLRSSDIPIYNIIAGHAWSLSLKFAGSASVAARDEILQYLEVFWACAKQDATYYDAQLTRTTLRRCVDILALSAATVMAGTGDLITFRYLRRLHGRTDADTTYGSHMAAHLAIGALFLGGGTYTFSTSNLAIAALITAFYPIFPSDVLDNAVHLQALRHLWVLAAEARCVVCVDADNGRPVPMRLQLKLKGGKSREIKTPCLLPAFDSLASIETMDGTYWQARLDFEKSANHLRRFRQDQTVIVRRAPATEGNPLVFSQTLTAMNEKQNMPSWFNMWAWLLDFPQLEKCVDSSELDLVLPANERSALQLDERGTVLDSRLTFWTDAFSTDVQRLRNVRLLLEWAAMKRLEDDSRLKWLGNAFIDRLDTVIGDRMSMVYIDEARD